MVAVSEDIPVPSALESVEEHLVLSLGNTALDATFRASPAGPVPEGDLSGTAVLFSGTRLARPLAQLVTALVWQGKVVDVTGSSLKNKVSLLRVRAIRALVSVDDSWVDGQPCVLIDYSRTSLVARTVRDEVRLVAPGFYLGVVWLGRRRVAWFTLRQQLQQR